MKKIWNLEKFYSAEWFKEHEATFSETINILEAKEDKTEEEIDLLAGFKARLQKRLAEGEWMCELSHKNYFTFSSRAKAILHDADIDAIEQLKKQLGRVDYSDEVKAMFKAAHQSVRDAYRVTYTEYDETTGKEEATKLNPGVYSYLYSNKG